MLWFPPDRIPSIHSLHRHERQIVFTSHQTRCIVPQNSPKLYAPYKRPPKTNGPEVLLTRRKCAFLHSTPQSPPIAVAPEVIYSKTCRGSFPTQSHAKRAKQAAVFVWSASLENSWPVLLYIDVNDIEDLGVALSFSIMTMCCVYCLIKIVVVFAIVLAVLPFRGSRLDICQNSVYAVSLHPQATHDLDSMLSSLKNIYHPPHWCTHVSHVAWPPHS